jgi:hypothetical protein
MGAPQAHEYVLVGIYHTNPMPEVKTPTTGTGERKSISRFTVPLLPRPRIHTIVQWLPDALPSECKTSHFLYKAPDFKVTDLHMNKYVETMIPSAGLVFSL